MNKQSNTYTIIYISALVCIVGAVLAWVSLALKPKQSDNIRIDKMQQMLSSIRITSTTDNAIDLYNKYVVDSYIVNDNGEKLSGEAFDISVASEIKKAENERQLPVFVCNIDNSIKYIIPVYGAGLWGPIWGYIAVESDGSTIYGAYFSHQGETPGLGAEIAKPAFADQFNGKHLYKGGEFKSISVIKNGNAPTDGSDYVDGISGGTITSKGVQSMLKSCLSCYQAFFNPLSKDNPVIVQVLGICSCLAVTAKLEPAIVMGISVTAVTAFSNVIISLIRNTIPNSIRIIVQLVVVAALVIIVDQFLKANNYEVSKQLSVFIGLIITNCILMGRLEAFALSNKPWPAFLDGVGNGIGYAIILIIVAAVRELLGSGTLLGCQIIPQALYDAGYQNNGLMILPPMALITVACIIWVHRSKNKDLQEKN